MREVSRSEFFAFVRGYACRDGARDGHVWMQYTDRKGNVVAQANYFRGTMPGEKVRVQYLIQESGS